jgi:hypothetical protein
VKAKIATRVTPNILGSRARRCADKASSGTTQVSCSRPIHTRPLRRDLQPLCTVKICQNLFYHVAERNLIRQWRQCISSLNECRHRFPPRFRIADEILADIFLLNANSAVEFWDRSRQKWRRDHDPRLTTRYSSQVCQRWRQVALGCFTLWGRIIHYTKDPLPWIDELLRRSHQTTLELCQAREFGQLVYPKLSVLSRLMCHAQRLKTVKMLVKQAAWQGNCEGIFQNRAPSLEYFHLIVPSIRGTEMFTGTLFSDNAPCLRRLHLRSCLVNLFPPALSNLTELSVASITFGAPTIDAWLSILGNMRFLC